MKRFAEKSVLLITGLLLILSISPVAAKTIKLTFSGPFPTMQTITGKIIKPWDEPDSGGCCGTLGV
jgi:hypothetical protein